TCTESLSLGNKILTSKGNSPPSLPDIPAKVFPLNGPVSTMHAGPVSHASPTSSLVPVDSYQGRRSLLPHTRSLNHGFRRKGAGGFELCELDIERSFSCGSSEASLLAFHAKELSDIAGCLKERSRKEFGRELKTACG